MRMKTTTLEERLEGACKVLGTGYAKVEILKNRLKEKMGLDFSDEAGIMAILDDEEFFKFGDFREALREVPIVPLRRGFAALKGALFKHTADIQADKLKALGHKPTLKDAPLEQLLELYTPSQSDPVYNVLRERYGDKIRIAFYEDGQVAVRETAAHVADLQNGVVNETETCVPSMVNDGQLLLLWPLGVVPDTLLDEDPLIEGKPLVRGRSSVNYYNWSTIAQESRQFCRLLLQGGHVRVADRENVLSLIERASDLKTLFKRYPDIAIQYKADRSAGALPSLKIPLKPNDYGRKQNPFGANRQY